MQRAVWVNGQVDTKFPPNHTQFVPQWEEKIDERFETKQRNSISAYYLKTFFVRKCTFAEDINLMN